MKKELRKLFNAYYSAEIELIKARDKAFPVGTNVHSIMCDMTATVISGSLYANQINTTAGHWAWYHVEKVKEKEGENHE